ncbi:MAG TPA: hypothetical protein VMV77_14195 [Bacteroidales bacterium]|nr:hypothetical protein [Bacteroidales bacterium]
MALGRKRGQFSIHSVCFYDRTNGVPISILKVLSEALIDFNAEFESLEGGSSMFPWDAEIKSLNGDVKISGREYEPNTMALLLGGDLTENAAEANGAIDEFENVKGTSIKSVANGIDAIELTALDADDLKEGKYLLVATAAGVVSLYGTSDVDFKRGTDLEFSDDTLLIEASLDVSSADVIIEELGITLSKVGTPNFTVGDTAEFYIRKPNTGSIEVEFGASGSEFSEIGIIIAGGRQSDGTIQSIELYRTKVAGMPIGFGEKAWSEWSTTIRALYDETRNAVGKYRRTHAA